MKKIKDLNIVGEDVYNRLNEHFKFDLPELPSMNFKAKMKNSESLKVGDLCYYPKNNKMIHCLIHSMRRVSGIREWEIMPVKYGDTVGKRKGMSRWITDFQVNRFLKLNWDTYFKLANR